MSLASWRKCDFQVHTPRDPNWKGDRPVGLDDIIEETGARATEEDVDVARKQWAEKFVAQCVAKELKAIAITDHHEMILVHYVQQAIAAHKSNDPDFDLWLFPGMELTARGGKQCLIIFDADLPKNWWEQAQGKLGIPYAGQNREAAKSVKVTQLTLNYPDIAEQLDTLNELRGHYIILPNVSQGNNNTVLVDYAHGDFHRMPYVGGYLDRGQTINTLRPKNIKRLSGEDGIWSAREIYPLPTSDSRSADYATLGENQSWIKLAEPTAEAIRQAFLGHRSRIRIEPPQVPSLAVKKIDIEGSTIIQNTNLSLSPELNSAIGGRGKGKSSFLEYLSFGLGRSCYDISRDHYSGTNRLSDLVKDTLVSKSGRVALTIVQDNAVFKVERGPANAHKPQVTYPNCDTQTVTTKELRALFPAVVHSQGELAEIGKQAGKNAQLTDLLQFVDPKYKREDDRLAQEIETAKGVVKTAVQKLTSYWEHKTELRRLKTSRDSMTQRVLALEKTLPKQSKEDQETIGYFDKADKFDSKRIQACAHADQILSEFEAAAKKLLNKRDIKSDLPDGDPTAIANAYTSLFETFSAGIKTLQDDLKSKRNTLTMAETAWAGRFKKARDARDAVLHKLREYRTVTANIINLREETTKYTNQIGDLESWLKAAGSPNEKLRQAVDTLNDANQSRTECTRRWAKEIETLSSGRIKAAVDPNGDTSEIKDAMDVVASKTGSQEATRINGLKAALADDAAPNVTDQLRQDCLSLLHWRQTREGSPSLHSKLMTVLGETKKILSALIKHIDTMRIEAISTAVAKPEIALSYCDGDQEISFEKASEGQRAAALLFMLLEQSGGPLIIDQPEGDLDNKIITDLTEKLHKAKQKRQLIFASHNANIVVNGSSELVAHLDIDECGQRKIARNGAIDQPEICDVITATMEGGEQAFKDRQEKYGY